MAFPRFLLAGVLNTGLTYVLYLGLLNLMPYVWAYSVTYIAGIGIGYSLNAFWVFRTFPSLRNITAYPFTYVLNYLFGLAILWTLVELIGVSKAIAPLIVLTTSVPFMFIITKHIFLKKHSYEKTNNK